MRLTIDEYERLLAEHGTQTAVIRFLVAQGKDDRGVRRWIKRNISKIAYEDKREYTEADIDQFYSAMMALQGAAQALNTKQVKAKITIKDDKPIGIAWWGDWHEGAIGTDYEALEADSQKILQTEGLYWIGAGDYKDNYISGTHVGGNFEQIIQPGMQDLAVKRRMRMMADQCLALVRGCHDSWDKKQGGQRLPAGNERDNRCY